MFELSECGDFEILKANLSAGRLTAIEEVLRNFNEEFSPEADGTFDSMIADWFVGNISSEKLIEDILNLDKDSGDILDKFDSVEIKNNSRLSFDDAGFCEERQALYEKISSHYREMYSGLSALQKLDADFNVSVAEMNINNSGSYPIYKADIFKFDEKDFLKLMKEIHNSFINQINRYFRDKYRISIEDKDAETYLGAKEPKEPSIPWHLSSYSEKEQEVFKKTMDEYKLEKKAYTDAVTGSVLHYDAVVDDIFISLGAFTFEEQAEKEIKEGAFEAAKGYSGDPAYLIKSKRISFDILHSHKCHIFKTYEVSLDSSNYKALLRALTYFDSDGKRLTLYDGWLNRFVHYRKCEGDGIYDTHAAHGIKVVSFKYFKNGKFEVEFTDHATALKFAGEYLGYREEAA